MLQNADFPVARALEILNGLELQPGLVVPTFTGFKKSIFDATENVRDYFRRENYHDYEAQGQGQDCKVKREAFLVRSDGFEKTYISMYRPETKSGDPRLWLGKPVKAYSQPDNLLALVIIDQTLFVLNMSDESVRKSIVDPLSPFRKELAKSDRRVSVADELLELLREIAASGFIRTLRSGHTGVGFTLETLLGIEANSSTAPDYKGIELKSKRGGAKRKSARSNLFSKVPNWRISPVSGSTELLKKRGYIDENGRLSLYQTLTFGKPTPKGLALAMDSRRGWLKQVFHTPSIDGPRVCKNPVHDTTWELGTLKSVLMSKHRETFWVHADCRGQGADEEFLYRKVQHTRSPIEANFPILIEAGVITVDYTLSLKGNCADDHGYLFKIRPTDLSALFPQPTLHDLI